MLKCLWHFRRTLIKVRQQYQQIVPGGSLRSQGRFAPGIDNSNDFSWHLQKQLPQ